MAADLQRLALTVPGWPSGQFYNAQVLAKARGSSRRDLAVVDIG
ncbi:hypothetical protein ACGFK1_16045 [Mycobacterium sp. NPDC048908]